MILGACLSWQKCRHVWRVEWRIGRVEGHEECGCGDESFLFIRCRVWRAGCFLSTWKLNFPFKMVCSVTFWVVWTACLNFKLRRVALNCANSIKSTRRPFWSQHREQQASCMTSGYLPFFNKIHQIYISLGNTLWQKCGARIHPSPIPGSVTVPCLLYNPALLMMAVFKFKFTTSIITVTISLFFLFWDMLLLFLLCSLLADNSLIVMLLLDPSSRRPHYIYCISSFVCPSSVSAPNFWIKARKREI